RAERALGLSRLKFRVNLIPPRSGGWLTHPFGGEFRGARWPFSSFNKGMRLDELEFSAPARTDLLGKRLLIFIVAYNAEATIEKVLKRIPFCLHCADVEVLIIDDSSEDNTFTRGLRFQQKNSASKITVLRAPENQGYGANR